MRGRVQILCVRPRLPTQREGHPAVGEAGRLGQRQPAHVVGEGLLEPQIVPPLHGHQVAEPHVRHLVEDDVGPRLVVRVGDLVPEDQAVGERDQARILHGAEVVLRNEDLVVLAPRVGVVEFGTEEVQPGLRDREDVGGIEMVDEAGARPCTQRDGLARRGVRPLIRRTFIGARRDAGDVTRLPQRRSEMVSDRGGVRVDRLLALLLARPATRLGPVRENLEVLGSRHIEDELGLEVRLVEVREHAAGIGRFVLGVEIDLAVGRVGEAVQPLARGGVVGLRLDRQDVLPRADGHSHARAVEHLGGVENLIIDLSECDRVCDQVDECAALGSSSELDDGPGQIRRSSGLGIADVDIDGVSRDIEHLSAALRFISGQVGCHS